VVQIEWEIRNMVQVFLLLISGILSAAPAGRVVDLHLSHGGLWLPLPPEWFNADRKPVRSDRITTVAKVDYYLFGRQTADRLRKLENRVEFGISDYGWRTRRSVFVPDILRKW
jgi:hypothetical protein